MLRDERQSAFLSLRTCLRPIVRLLLKVGIGYREFESISKECFVDVATNEFGIRDRPTNISRVAILTGLSRKEIKHYRDDLHRKKVKWDSIERRSIPAEVLHYWHTVDGYIDACGKPKAIAFSGASVSFDRLVKMCGVDVPPGAMRTELVRVGAVHQRSDGMLEVVKREFVPIDLNERLSEGVNFGLRMLAATIDRNTCPSSSSTDIRPRFQRVVSTVRLDSNRVLQLEQELGEQLQLYASDIDNRLSAYETANRDENGTEFAVGFYIYVDDGVTK